ncbi:Tripartite motif-containing protein 16 [Labeo rohita]|uniref:Tripartite motif-containing protein 16 n=1 Tax=Labeo rohita TaxID=84645 RepID=A0ABQ8L8J9_LABRO|nr:Tripartite motif-containing protein 16 [Labeo rohita]
MAETSISVGKDQFSCLICLDLLKDPVTIPCGHSYCMNCITDCWNKEDKQGLYSCPQCRQTFTPRPALKKNVMLADIVDNLKNTITSPIYAGPGDVECDSCTGRKRKALKSCLMCLESYCQSHFECHEESHPRKRHKVTDATGRIQEMICSKHDRLLEVFCRSDQKCICLICVMDEHKNHNIVSAEAERTEKQKQLGETVTVIQKKIQERQTELQKLRESVQTHKRSAQTAVKDSERIFTELIHCIERSHSEVIQMIRDREKAEVSRAEGLLMQLQQEIDDLRKRDAELKQLLNTENHIHFLQNFQFLSVPPASSHSTTVSSLLSYDDVKSSVSIIRSKLENFCREEIEKISGGVNITIHTPITEPRTREHFLHYYHKFTLDLESVHKHLCLSDGNKVAACTATLQPYPDHPDRFDVWPQVLCRESVCGRCYWEVEWSGTRGVGISVSYKSISRKGQVSSSRRIGVYVDHSAGILSFYSVSDTMTLIHRVQTTFTQPLYPGFGITQGSSMKLCHLEV